MMNKEEKVALITGASSGIGAAYAKRFAKDGYDIIITGRRKEKIDKLAKEIKEKYDVAVDIFIIELSDSRQVDLFIEKIKDRNIKVLINNAGFAIMNSFVGESLGKQEQMVAVHITCTMRLMHLILPKMIEDDEGIIINISSQNAFLVIPNNATYSGTKAFLNVFSESIHLELMKKKSNVRIQSLCPGAVKTDFYEKMGVEVPKNSDKGIMRFMSPDELVDISLKGLEKGRVVYKVGLFLNLGIAILKLLPRKLYYKIASNF